MKRALLAGLAAACGATPAAPAPLANRSPAPLPDEAFSTQALAGPYRTLADYCTDAARRAHEAAGDDDDPDAPLGCQRGTAFVDAGPTHAGAASLVPFRADAEIRTSPATARCPSRST